MVAPDLRFTILIPDGKPDAPGISLVRPMSLVTSWDSGTNGTGVPVSRFELVDVTGRRVAVVKDALRAVLSPPHRGIFLIRAVFPDGRVAKQKVVAVR